jgi:hypothetical protein
MAASQLLTLSRIFKTDTNHGILNNQLKPCSRQFKTVLISQRPEVLQLERHNNFLLLTPKFSSQENSTVPAAEGMKNLRPKRLGTISRFIFRVPIASTDTCREKLWVPKDLTIQQ